MTATTEAGSRVGSGGDNDSGRHRAPAFGRGPESSVDRLARAAKIGLVGVAAAVVGAVTAKDSVPMVAIAAAAAMTLVAVLAWQAHTLRRGPIDPPADRSMVIIILAGYLLPLFVLSRVYSLVGANPIYLPDVLALLAAFTALARARWRYLTGFAICNGLIAVLMLHATYVGHQHHYADAIKGLVLVIYPAVAVPIAGWIVQLKDPDRLLAWLPKLIFPAIPLGLVLVHGHHMIPSAFGLELGMAGAFAVVRGMPARKILIAAVVLGVFLLIGWSAKRGVTVTIVAACAAAWVASRRLQHVTRRMIICVACISLAGIFALSIIGGIVTIPQSTPLIGRLAFRASGNQSAASDNVTLRLLMWKWALSTTAENDPVLGQGAYHPIDVQLKSFNVALKTGIGVHDSFVGYTYYAGYPCGFLVVFVYGWGLWRLWRVRRRSIYAPALFGAVVAAIVTAATNVSFEVTYMGGPSWVFLGIAFGYSAWLMDRPELDPDYEDETNLELDDGRDLVIVR